MINIAIIDDQVVVRQGIIQLIELNPDYKVIFEAGDGEEGINALADSAIDIIISDIRMPRMNGVEFIKAIRARKSKTPVLVLTTFDDNEWLLKAISAGANGFLLKDVTLEKLSDAIDAVAAGKYLFEPQSIPCIDSHPLQSQALAEALNDTEKQILRFAAAGFSNKEISSCMFLAEGTVKNYFSKILEKTYSRDRTQAVVKAMSLKLI